MCFCILFFIKIVVNHIFCWFYPRLILVKVNIHSDKLTRNRPEIVRYYDETYKTIA